MRRTVTTAMFLLAGPAVAFSRPVEASGTSAPERAVSEGRDVSAAAIAELRGLGRPGLSAFLAEHDATLRDRATNGDGAARRARVLAALDAVAAQKDADTSRLFWHTDLERAVADAKASGRPILSLRMLGRLDEDCSCANSRFFRTALYANGRVSEFLRDGFVLHWRSVRPVPVVTIDFGDGRTLVRTVTGNSAHYVLDSEGRVVDAILGLYGPEAFLRSLGRAREAALASVSLDPAERATYLRDVHAEWGRTVQHAWAADLARVGLGISTSPVTTRHEPTASEAAAVAVGKRMIELPVIVALQPGTDVLDERTDAVAWRALAALHGEDARLDDASVALIRRKTPSASMAGERAITKLRLEDPILRMVRRFEEAIAEDTVRNEYRLHARIHAWFAEGSAPTQVEALNERVYAELFLTPSDDPWLGLLPADTYTALDGS